MAGSKELTKVVIERCLETELDTHLGYPNMHARATPLATTAMGIAKKRSKESKGM